MSGLANSYEIFLISRIILGFGEGMMIPVSGKLISNWFNKRELGRAPGILAYRKLFRTSNGSRCFGACDIFTPLASSFLYACSFQLIYKYPDVHLNDEEYTRRTPRISKEELAFIRQTDDEMKETAPSENKKSFAQDYRFWIVWFGMLVCSFLFFRNQHLASYISH
ncbi:hypothetical protein RCO48_28040 [Peribacillus frigoritolerans]|nr:hypothetical protein [Peribacillus frigoritolerans]